MTPAETVAIARTWLGTHFFPARRIRAVQFAHLAVGPEAEYEQPRRHNRAHLARYAFFARPAHSRRAICPLSRGPRRQSMNNRVVTIARTWLGTPYHHQASVKGVGCDCLGLVRGVYAEAYGRPAEEPPAYTRDLAEACQTETLLEAARRHLIEIDVNDFAAGDVVVFRLRPGAMAKHCGIISACEASLVNEVFGAHGQVGQSRTDVRRAREASLVKMIHAFESGPVCEINLSSWWRRKIAAAFRFAL